jgi:hypothetical protein
MVRRRVERKSLGDKRLADAKNRLKQAFKTAVSKITNIKTSV